ncbi:uracil-DNA glycosylase, partial [Candidatus Dependentiae bacterium]|nr:uracil-DNA glycosylase [Candidatus Dependentiae bacterium]
MDRVMNTPTHQKSAEFNVPLSKEERLQRLFSETKKNTHLPYFNPQEQFIAGFGNKDSKIVFIGEAPGKEESIQGKPFVGKSGKLLSELLLQHGIKREELYITNVVKYRPPNNKTPDYAECMAWASACLHEELSIIQPQIIVTLGACATKVF